MNAILSNNPLKQFSFIKNSEEAQGFVPDFVDLNERPDCYQCTECKEVYDKKEDANKCQCGSDVHSYDRVSEVDALECPQCQRLYADQEEALECCSTESNKCPCCLKIAEDGPEQAVECCLFVDLNHAQRYLVNRLRSEGATWEEAIEKVLNLAR